MNPCLLPPGLLDLTLSRASCRVFAPGQLLVRHAHAAAQTSASTEYGIYPHLMPQSAKNVPDRFRRTRNQGALKVRSGQEAVNPHVELERRVKALEEVAIKEESALDAPFFSEDDLMSIYEDLLALPEQEISQTSKQEDVKDEVVDSTRILESAQERLLALHASFEDDASSTSLATTLRLKRKPAPVQAVGPSTGLPTFSKPSRSSPLYYRVLWHVNNIATRFRRDRLLVIRDLRPEEDSGLFPLDVLSMEEWEALIQVSLEAGDTNAAEISLVLLMRCGLPLPEGLLNIVLRHYSSQGNISAFEEAIARFVSGLPTDAQRHLHVRAYMKSSPPDQIPTSALTLLHTYEDKSLPAPMKTYNSIISQLYTIPSSTAHAHAWDIFSHMRYAAHSNPDVPLYSTMIRACASPIAPSFSSEPERALDLWTEMVVTKKLIPTVGTYNAVILACARSGEKKYVNEAFRIAKEMLDSHRDARGQRAYTPDRKTFSALLEGAKRLGDLARVRWILAEMVNGDKSLGEGLVDTEVLMHVFHAYAAYNPPFKRELAPVVDSSPSTSTAEPSTAPTGDADTATQRQDITSLDAQEGADFKHIPPQSKHEVISEVEALFSRALGESSSADPSHKLRNVQLTPKLFNAYMSVHYRHSSIAKARHIFWRIFDEHGVERTPRTYLEALNRCSYIGKRDRGEAFPFAKELMEAFTILEDAPREEGKAMDARLIENTHALWIRTLVHQNMLIEAVDHLRSFVARYPPRNIRQPSPKPAYRSTRTNLVGLRPLVRLSSVIEVPDDYVPPLMMFRDLELLHHRLAGKGMEDEVGYVKYVCKSYEWALRVRRDEAVKAKPVGGS